MRGFIVSWTVARVHTLQSPVETNVVASSNSQPSCTVRIFIRLWVRLLLQRVAS
jgi:hypothetical protein